MAMGGDQRRAARRLVGEVERELSYTASERRREERARERRRRSETVTAARPFNSRRVPGNNPQVVGRSGGQPQNRHQGCFSCSPDSMARGCVTPNTEEAVWGR